MSAPHPTAPTEPAEAPATAPGSAARRRLTTTLVVVLSLAAGILVGDRFLPFRDTGVSYASGCGGLFSAADLAFLPQTTPTGRRVASAAFEEVGEGSGYRFVCRVHGDGEQQLGAWVQITEVDKKAWREDLDMKELLPGRVKPLQIVSRDDLERSGQDIVALSADSGAALYLPCELPEKGDFHLNLWVRAWGASDGDADDQRLAIAAVASRIASRAITNAGCLEPALVPEQSPTFAS